MPIRDLLLNRRRLIIMGGSTAVLVVGILMIVGLSSLFRSEPTPDELRVQHIDYLSRLLDAYYERFGSYPHPALRTESASGIEHVWGYRPDTPALASCTVATDESGAANALLSSCGGDVHDADGMVIGWKGVLGIDSALNGVADTALRPETPLSELVQALPTDPAFANPVLSGPGFGEYVYAVRMPEDGSKTTGAQEYQLATTITNPTTGKLETYIRGNYFVSSTDTTLPPSLIGPGTVDNHTATTALHVLVDGQEQGKPSPLLGEGELLLELLSLRQQVRSFKNELNTRREAAHILRATDIQIDGSIDHLMNQISTLIESTTATQGDLDSLTARLNTLAASLQSSTEQSLSGVADASRDLLQVHAEKPAEVRSVLESSLESIMKVTEQVLLARDEIVKYLSGDGIEEQTRGRAGRKVALALEAIPNVQQNFTDAGLLYADHFLQEKEAEALAELFPEAEFSTEIQTPTLKSASITITTMISELRLLTKELTGLLEEIQDDLTVPSVAITDIDEKLDRLAAALSFEEERLTLRLSELATAEKVSAALDEFDRVREESLTDAVTLIAEFSSLYGAVHGMAFDAENLESTLSDQEPGLPDLELVADPLMAEYKGIPYPLP